MSSPAIAVDGLTRDFRSVRAVDGLTLEIPAGIIFGFLGANGAGKTTTIQLLLGLLEPTAGRATVLGFDPVRQGEEVRSRTGALLEHPGLYERLSAEENLEFWGRAWRIPAPARRARIRELLEPLDLWERRKEPVGTWSRGMKQKVAVARALLHRPPLVFLDEPTAGLDAVSAAALREALAGIVEREGTTVFLTTHNLSEAERLCAQVAVVRRGRLVASGHPHELRTRSAAPRVQIVGRGIGEEMLRAIESRPEVAAASLDGELLSVDLHGQAPVAPLVTLLVNGGAELEEVRKGAATLEDAFLSMMEEG